MNSKASPLGRAIRPKDRDLFDALTASTAARKIAHSRDCPVLITPFELKNDLFASDDKVQLVPLKPKDQSSRVLQEDASATDSKSSSFLSRRESAAQPGAHQQGLGDHRLAQELHRETRKVSIGSAARSEARPRRSLSGARPKTRRLSISRSATRPAKRPCCCSRSNQTARNTSLWKSTSRLSATCRRR